MMCYGALKSNIDQCRIILHKLKCINCLITFNTPRFFLCTWIDSRDCLLVFFLSFLVLIHSVSRIFKLEISIFSINISTLIVKISKFEVHFFRLKRRNFKIESKNFDIYFSTISLIRFRK